MSSAIYGEWAGLAGSFAGDAGAAIAGAVYFAINLIYWPLLESSERQATFGKQLLGLQVEHADGGRTSFLRALGRNLAKFISAIPLGIGFLIAAFTGRKQCLHDMIAKCVVVRTGPSQFLKALIAAVLGLAIAVGSASAYFYYVYLPGLTKEISSGMQDMMKEAMKTGDAMKTLPASPPPAKAPSPGAAAPATSVTTTTTTTTTTGKDQDFDQLAGPPLTGLEKPGTTRAGPAILELSTFFTSNFWIKAHLPVITGIEFGPAPEITVTRVLDSAGKNAYDPANTFEKSSFFRRTSLSLDRTPVPHYSGTRTVHVMTNTSEQAVQKIEGQISITIPMNVQFAAFDASETGKEKTVNGAAVTLKSVSGNDVVMHYRGAAANLLTLRGSGKDGKAVAIESRQLPGNSQNIDASFQTRFRAPVAKIEVAIASGLLVREFPFSLARGATAGPPTVAAVTTKPGAPVAAAGTAPAPTPATPATPATAAAPATNPAPTAAASKPAPAKAEALPATAAVPKTAMDKEASSPAVRRPPRKPRPADMQPTQPGPAPGSSTEPSPTPAGAPQSAMTKPCIIRPVMTDDEIESCRRRP